jgi:hypothetical protein
LLQLVLVAAIASTISSVIGPIMKNRKGFNKIYIYRIYDVLAPAAVLIMCILELVIMKRYSLDYSAWFIIIKPVSYWFITIIIIALGWGLVYHVISQYLRRKISRNKVNEDDLLNAMKIVKELQKKVEDQREIGKYGEQRETRRETRNDTRTDSRFNEEAARDGKGISN